MEWPPFSFYSVSLWLAVTTIILLITAELISSYDGPATVLVNTKRLRFAALALGSLFLITVTIRILGIIMSPS